MQRSIFLGSLGRLQLGQLGKRSSCLKRLGQWLPGRPPLVLLQLAQLLELLLQPQLVQLLEFLQQLHWCCYFNDFFLADVVALHFFALFDCYNVMIC